VSLALPLAILSLAAVLAGALVPWSRRLARTTGALDRPGLRKIHTRATPRLGGVAVFVPFILLVLGGRLITLAAPEADGLTGRFGSVTALLTAARHVDDRLVALMAGAGAIFCVGLLDDLLGDRFPVWLKALGQLSAASILVIGGDVTTSFLPFAWLNTLVALLWLFAITNAFNLLDNMDGLSAGVALIASSILFATAWLLDEPVVAVVLAAFIGSVAGFLFFNLRPEFVFLGDCGSLLVGYTIGALTLLVRYGSHASSSLFPVLMPLVVLAVPIVDTATVVAIRLRENRPIYVGDKRHLSHQLVALGFSRREAVLILYLVAASLGLAAFPLVDASPEQSLAILLQAGGIAALMLTLTFRIASARPPGRQLPAFDASVASLRTPAHARSRTGAGAEVAA